jgi:hypothetical protein
MISRALHPSIFEQPAFIDFFNNLLEHFPFCCNHAPFGELLIRLPVLHSRTKNRH